MISIMDQTISCPFKVVDDNMKQTLDDNLSFEVVLGFDVCVCGFFLVSGAPKVVETMLTCFK